MDSLCYYREPGIYVQIEDLLEHVHAFIHLVFFSPFYFKILEHTETCQGVTQA